MIGVIIGGGRMLLNVRSVYSLLLSTLRIDEYIQAAKEHGYKAIGLADDKVLTASLDFYSKAKESGLKPLVGLKLSMQGILDSNQDYPFLLYAKSYLGYQHLMKISRLIQKEQIKQLEIWSYLKETEDLVYISLGRPSEMEQAIIHDNEDHAVLILQQLRDTFGLENLYMGLPIYPYNPVESDLLNQFALENNIPQAMVQMINSLHSEEAFSLKILQAISDNEQIDASIQNIHGANHLYSLEQLRQMYYHQNLGHVYESTQSLVDKLNVDIDLKQNYLPKYPLESDESSDDYLRKLSHQSLISLGHDKDPVYLERLNYELDIITQMGFSDYFLIVWDIMTYCHRKKIRTGPGRGSAAGSLVSYLLQITLVDPIEFDLVFERFLNPERRNMPDIDIDIPDDKRDLVLRYIQKRYGYEQVAQIVTLGSFGAKQAIRDTLRVLGAEGEELRRWSRAIPSDQNQTMTLERAYKLSAPLRKIIEESPQNRNIFKAALTIEGLPRHTSTHAAAVVISDQVLNEIIPVKDRPDDLLITQYTMYDVEKMGLLKMDFLGLRNLSILDNVLTFIKSNHSIEIDINQIPLDDYETLELFRQAETNGVFQFESEGIKQVLYKLQPASFEDIVAVNALYRPGPMKQIDSYIRRKNGQEEIQYIHPILEAILKNTYGIIVYQEQVMQIVVTMASFTMGEADILRRAMGKKQMDLMESQRQHFLEGAIANGYKQEDAESVFNYIYEFSNYGFNRAHAVVYSTLAYQLAYLKVHYPKEFYASLLNSGGSQMSTFHNYIQEAKNVLGKILAPDINKSIRGFSIQGDLMVGLDAIKGASKDLISHIIEDRNLLGNYKSFVTFLQRLSKKHLKFETIESLINAGCFDNFGYNRATLVQNLNSLIQYVEYSGQSMSLFQEMEPKIEWVEDYNIFVRLEKEKEALGFTLSGHPLDAYKSFFEGNNYIALEDLKKLKDKRTIKTIALVDKLRVITTKNDELMAFVQISSQNTEMTLVVFPQLFLRSRSLLVENNIIALQAKLDFRRNEMQLIANSISNANDIENEKQESNMYRYCFIQIGNYERDRDKISKLKEIALSNPGPASIILVDREKNSFKLDNSFSIGYSNRVRELLTTLFGYQNVVYR